MDDELEDRILYQVEKLYSILMNFKNIIFHILRLQRSMPI
jgi:hypothetical protein